MRQSGNKSRKLGKRPRTEQGNNKIDNNRDDTNNNPRRNRPERQSNEGSQSTH
jgi:hypothetical protein